MESIDTGLLLGRTRLRLSAHPGQFLFVELFFCEEEPRRAHPVPPLGEHSPGNFLVLGQACTIQLENPC